MQPGSTLFRTRVEPVSLPLSSIAVTGRPRQIHVALVTVLYLEKATSLSSPSSPALECVASPKERLAMQRVDVSAAADGQARTVVCLGYLVLLDQ